MTTAIARNTRRALTGLAGCMLVLLLLAATLLVYLQHQLDEVDRIAGVFDGLDQRPDRPASGPGAAALNVLLLGTDRRSDSPTTGTEAEAPAWLPGAQRSDLLMLVHIDAARERATLISLPRDSWVEVPGYGETKINAAYSYGGPSLAVQTVEQLTDVRIDHLAVIDWDGFRELTDAVGGISVEVPETVVDTARGLTWTAGEHHLDGAEALAYVGQRYGLPQGDLDRVRRQQKVLATLADATLERRANPGLAFDLIGMLTRHVSVDDEWSSREMAELAWAMRGVGRSDIRYLTVPVSGFGREGQQSVVRLDRDSGAELWEAVRADRIDDWIADDLSAAATGPVP